MSETVLIEGSITKKKAQSLLKNIDDQPIDKQRAIFSQVLKSLGGLTEKEFENPDKLLLIVEMMDQVSDTLWNRYIQKKPEAEPFTREVELEAKRVLPGDDILYNLKWYKVTSIDFDHPNMVIIGTNLETKTKLAKKYAPNQLVLIRVPKENG